MHYLTFVVFLGLQGEMFSFRKDVCIGNSNSIDSPSYSVDENLMYQTLKEHYEGCKYVEGNLEVKFLTQTHYNMSFLSDIREVTGYVLLLLLYPEVITFPNLRVIRGNELYDGSTSLFVATTYHYRDNNTGLKQIHFPVLHEILKGEVVFVDNRDLCYVETIDWSDMREGLVPVFQDHAFGCVGARQCAPECPGGCWGPEPSMCQTLTRKNCSGTCDYRCRGPTQADCCHKSCAASCTGPSNRECLACLTFTMDDQCLEACPSRTKYNPETFQSEPNPDFRYTYGQLCLTSCPDNVVEVGDSCLNECPPNKVEKNNKCVECDHGICPKICDGLGDKEIMYLDSFDDGKLTNCTIIKKNIFIGAMSFVGDSFTAQPPITMELLERLSTVQEIKGYLTVQGHSAPFTSLSFFRNLKKIYGRRLYGTHALSVTGSTLQTLDLNSLESIISGTVNIKYNLDLCYLKREMFEGIVLEERDRNINIDRNANVEQCVKDGLVCDEECAPIGCWGPGNWQCARCQNAQIDDVCVSECDQQTQYRVKAGNVNKPTICEHCDPQCQGNCTGPGPRNCTECQNVKDGPFCRAACPSSKYPDEIGVCQPCHANCNKGCTGPANLVGVGGCNQVILDEVAPTVVHVRHTQVSKMCHSYCLGCIGPGPSMCIQCKDYKRGAECVEECGINQYSDENNTCIDCHAQCRDCSGGSAPRHCLECQNFIVFVSENQTYCAEKCPKEQPYIRMAVECVATCSQGEFPNPADNRCTACHHECLGGCHDDRRSSCFQCKNVLYNDDCIVACPRDYNNTSGICTKDRNAEYTKGSQGSSLSSGELAGICIAVVALIVCTVLIGIYLYKKHTKNGFIQMNPNTTLQNEYVYN